MYAKYEDGNTLTFDDLQKYLTLKYPKKGLKVEEFFYPRVRDIVIDTVLSNKRVMNTQGKTNVFELFGFDFLIDEDFRTWLIEVNQNPYLGTPNSFMEMIVP